MIATAAHYLVFGSCILVGAPLSAAALLGIRREEWGVMLLMAVTMAGLAGFGIYGLTLVGALA